MRSGLVGCLVCGDSLTHALPPDPLLPYSYSHHCRSQNVPLLSSLRGLENVKQLTGTAPYGAATLILNVSPSLRSIPLSSFPSSFRPLPALFFRMSAFRISMGCKIFSSHTGLILRYRYAVCVLPVHLLTLSLSHSLSPLVFSLLLLCAVELREFGGFDWPSRQRARWLGGDSIGHHPVQPGTCDASGFRDAACDRRQPVAIRSTAR